MPSEESRIEGVMPHNIIDNRSNKLLDTILTTLPGTERARFGAR